MKKKVTLLVVAVMALATVAAYAGTATINMNVSVTLPTYLSMTLTDTVTSASATSDGSLDAAWAATGTPGAGAYATSNQYKLNVVCNDMWNTTIQLAGGKMTRQVTGEALAVEEAHAASATLGSFTAMTDAAIPTASGDMTSGIGVDSYYQFRVPYTWSQRAGVYTGTIVFTTVCP